MNDIFGFKWIKVGDKVKVLTVETPMIGTVISIQSENDHNDEIAEVRLTNGYLLQRIRPMEVSKLEDSK
jgi:hypothetical protein